MSYVTTTDLTNRLGSRLAIELTDDTGAGAVVTARLTKAVEEAEGELDSYLATRYQTPVDLALHPTIAATLCAMVLDIAVYRLHGRRGVPNDQYTEVYNAAVAWLDRIRKGDVVLPGATTPSPAVADLPGARWGAETRVAGREFIV